MYGINVPYQDRLDPPSATNRNRELFDWILGGLYQEQMGIDEYLQKKGVKLPGQSAFACFGAKTADPNILWQLFKDEIFKKNEGAEFIQKLKQLTPKSL